MTKEEHDERLAEFSKEDRKKYDYLLNRYTKYYCVMDDTNEFIKNDTSEDYYNLQKFQKIMKRFEKKYGYFSDEELKEMYEKKFAEDRIMMKLVSKIIKALNTIPEFLELSEDRQEKIIRFVFDELKNVKE